MPANVEYKTLASCVQDGQNRSSSLSRAVKPVNGREGESATLLLISFLFSLIIVSHDAARVFICQIHLPETK